MKALCSLAIILGISFGALGQGTVIVNNASSQMIWAAEGIPAPLGTHVAFYYSPTAVSPGDGLNSSLHLIANGIGTITPVSGQFMLGTKTTDTDAAPGSTIYGSVRAWYSAGNAYRTWDEAVAAMWSGTAVWLGYSRVFQVPTGNPTASPPTLPPALSAIAGFTGVALYAPEPTSFALVAFGAAAVLIFRHRSKSL